jgi:four helix bundle protein
MAERVQEPGKKARIVQFEDLIAWQKARDLTKAVYIASAAPAFARDRGLQDQIRGAAVSVMSNIAEGFERGGRAEFHQFLAIAKASCAEVRSQLYVASDVGYLDDADFNRLRALTQDASRIIGALKSAVRKQRQGS